MANEIPKKIGQYELRKIIGRGGMATVWLAYQPSLDRDVAIKLMASQFSDNEDFNKRFNQEARSIARLRHPNILAIYEYGQADNDQPYIVTELLDGGTLREYMTSKRLDLREIGRILGQIADALDYAHSQDMVHRDIKPSNILMGTQRTFGDRAVLSDFGIVKLLSSTGITQTGVGIGTAEYMSPEQAAGERLDGRSDEYSLGIVLYEMLTGVTPYKADTPLAVMMGHVNRPLPDPRTFNPNLSPAIVETLSRALAKFPDGRYDSAGAFAEAFQQAVGATISQTPTAVPFRPAPTGPTNPGPPSTQAGTISSAQAYDYALLQERQGNHQAAFETLTDLQRREPGYRDVGPKLKEYESLNYQYSGNHTLFRPLVLPFQSEDATRALNVGPLKSPTVSSPYVPSDPTGPAVYGGSPITTDNGTLIGSHATPGGTAIHTGLLPRSGPRQRKGLSPALLGLGIGAIGLIAVVIGAIVILGGSKTPTVTPVAVANSTVTTAAGGIFGPITTSSPTTAITPSVSPAATTAAVPTVTPLPTSPPEKADPARTQVNPVVSQMYKSDGNLKDGVTKLKEIVKNSKDSWLARRELGRSYYWYVREQGGISYLKDASQLNQQDALSWAYLALEYADSFQDAESQAAVRQAVNLDPNSAEVRAASAITLIRQGPQQAREELKKALDLDPENLLVNYAAWSVFLTANDFTNALTYLDKILVKYPNFAVLAYSKGYHFDRQGNSADAVTWYNKALAIDPDFPLAHTGLGQAARLKGDFKKAEEEYRKTISVYDNDVNAYIGLGYTLESLQNPKEATQQFLKALKLDKNNPEAFNGLAGVYLEQAKATTDPTAANNNIDLALNQLDQALAIAPNYADAYYHKGAAYFLKKQYPNAEMAFKKAVELNNTNALYYYSLGATYFKMNDLNSAKFNVKKAIELDPNFKEAQDLLKALGG